MQLREMCCITMGQSPNSDSYNEEREGVPFFQGNADFGERYPNVRTWCKEPKKMAKNGDVLISVRAPIGAINYAKETCCIGRGLAALSPKTDKVSKEFIFWVMKSRCKELQMKGTGSTFKAISKKILEEVKIPLYPLEKQIEYSLVLEKVYAIIETYKSELQKLDELIQARFVEMFGDPITNSFGWEEHWLDEYIEFLTSGSRGWAKYFTDVGNELFITIKNVKNNQITIDNIQYINAPNSKEAKRTRVKTGDLLISITADLGRTGVVDEAISKRGAYINQHLSLVRLDQSRINPLYVSYFLETEGGKKQFESKNQNGVKAGLNFEAIRSLKILVPPMELQEKYLTFVNQVNKSKVEIQQALEKTQLLFDSLMQQYFG